MSLREQVMGDMKAAMKAKEADRLSAIRMLQAALKNKEIELRPNDMTEQDALGVVRKLVKQRKDSIEEYQKAQRQDLVDKESFELTVLEAYLPAQMTKEQVEKIVNEVIQDLGATEMKQMGGVVKEVQARTAGSADGKTISEIVKSRLQS
ncbi:MAG TPA: glutamyl-tRNA amidotransferase [Bdellovibrionales bacterium]|nr:glutamyl-tRNA amidotransferase [Pseudobdellovibrionaceae bacterium]HAG92372.1 glutamyl-tRNA amidotransferase [Bdellovibrionales bacterium]|tara:strand:- start:2522 stop:2971 length:450 start_codon:yes stop_codon:yes gene_type:complete